MSYVCSLLRDLGEAEVQTESLRGRCYRHCQYQRFLLRGLFVSKTVEEHTPQPQGLFPPQPGTKSLDTGPLGGWCAG